MCLLSNYTAQHLTHYTVYYSITQTPACNPFTLQSNFTDFFSCSIFENVDFGHSLKYYSLAMVLAENSKKNEKTMV